MVLREIIGYELTTNMELQYLLKYGACLAGKLKGGFYIITNHTLVIGILNTSFNILNASLNVVIVKIYN